MADRNIVGDTIRLTNSFYSAGALADPGTVTLVVVDPSGNTEGTYTYAGGTVTKSVTGVYYKDLAVDEDGVWEFTWTGTSPVADKAVGTFTVYPAEVNDIDVLTLAEAKMALNVDQSVSNFDDYLRVLITAVSGQLDQLCGPIRNRTVTDELHDGGDWTIRLRRRPVYSITSVTEYDGTTATTLTAETNASKPSAAYLHDGNTGTLSSGLLRRRSNDADDLFESGRRNVAVTYVTGRAANTEVVPAKFKQAAVMMLRNIWTAEMASGSQTFGAFTDPEVNPLLGPGLLNKVAALLDGEMIDGVWVA